MTDLAAARAGTRRLVSGVVWNMLGRGLPLLVALALTPPLVAALGIERWGLFTLALGLVGVFGVFDLGLGAALTRTLEGAMLHSLSRALYEEVRFDTEKVLSTDWASHPTLTHQDVPETIDVIHVNGDPNPNRPDLPHYGAGETACKPLLAAVANAIYDATGVRLRRVPFRPQRVLEALKTQRA